jgi:hypothetical protein
MKTKFRLLIMLFLIAGGCSDEVEKIENTCLLTSIEFEGGSYQISYDGNKRIVCITPHFDSFLGTDCRFRYDKSGKPVWLDEYYISYEYNIIIMQNQYEKIVHRKDSQGYIVKSEYTSTQTMQTDMIVTYVWDQGNLVSKTTTFPLSDRDVTFTTFTYDRNPNPLFKWRNIMLGYIPALGEYGINHQSENNLTGVFMDGDSLMIISYQYLPNGMPDEATHKIKTIFSDAIACRKDLVCQWYAYKSWYRYACD